MRSILVTGGAGYIGSHTCKALVQQGYTPIVYDNLSEGHAEFVRWGEFVEGDIRDTDRLSKAISDHRASAVVHFAASAYVGESVANPQKYYSNNLFGSLSVLEAMQLSNCQQLVFSSTCAVYGNPTKIPVDLHHPTNPVSPYGKSKLMVEQVLADYAKSHEFNYVALRYFNAAGADADGEIGERHIPETHLIPNAINAALGGEHLTIFGDDYPTADGSCVRDYVHVTDLASAHVAALQKLEREGGAHCFNLGAQRGVSVLELVKVVEQECKTSIQTNIADRRSGDAAELYADSSDTKNGLGWQAEHSDISNIVRSAVAWAKQEIDSK